MPLPANDPEWVFEPFYKRNGKYILLATVILFFGSLCFCFWKSMTPWASFWLPLLGSFWLGVLIGMLLSFFVVEAETFTGKALGSAVAAITAAGVLALLRGFDHPAPEVWFYPMGLVSGF